MKPFKWMFEEQNATEIEYKGKQVSSFYRYDKKGKYRLKFTFVSTNSQHEQSIILHLEMGIRDRYQEELTIRRRIVFMQKERLGA